MVIPVAQHEPCLRGGTIVISQPMYFPWVGQLEQIALADAFVFYDDVQYSRGGFFNRVQIKSAQGTRWMTVPLRNQRLGQLINEVRLDNQRGWQRSQIDAFRQAYKGAPFLKDALALMAAVLDGSHSSLAELSMASTYALANYYSLDANCRFLQSSQLSIGGHGTRRVVDSCAALGAGHYLTGHGGRRYLEHEAFEEKGIDVSYINYGYAPYPQLHGGFTPYVTALDLVANCGPQGKEYIRGNSMPWRKFISPNNGSHCGVAS